LSSHSLVSDHNNDNDSSTGCCCFSKSTRQKFQASLDLTVLKEPAFIFLTTIDCLLGMTIGSMSWALPFYAQERGMTPAFGATLLSTGAACEFVGRFIIPPLFDVKWINYQYLFTLLLLLAAGASAGKTRFEISLLLVYFILYPLSRN
jgi:fucose permease